MTGRGEHFTEKNPNPILSAEKNGTVLYSNEAAKPLLTEWGVEIGEKLPSSIGELVQRVISTNNPEKMEVKVEKKVYLVVFHPLPKQECVNISGFDISDQIKLEGELHESEVLEIPNLELPKIIDAHTIQSLMDDFYRLAHIPMGLIDLKGNILASVAWQDICTKFHRIHPETCKNCIESDIKLSVGVPPGEFKLYRCKNNMWDVVTPITVGGKHIANIYSGQFFFEDEPLDYELFRSQARKYGFNEEEYIAALEKVPRLSREAVNEKMSFFMKLANILSQLSYSNCKLAKSLAERDNLVDKLEKNKEDLNRAQAMGNIGSWRLDVSKNELTWSDENHRIFGIPKGTPLTYETFLSIVYPDDREYVDRKWKMGLKGEAYDIKHRIVVDDKIKWVREKAYLEFDKDKMVIGGFGTTQDITERRQAEHQLSNELARATGLYELYTRSSNLSDRELYDFALNQAVKITDSTIGFFHIASEDEKEIILTAWNPEALRSCTAGNEGHYPIEKAGNWVDCVRLKRSVVYNDFPSSPNQKGLPAGHATVKRFMSVPITENGKVRIIFGVGNKVDDYDDRDVMQLQLVANELHKIMKLRRIEKEVRESEEKYRIIADNTYDWEFWLDSDGRFLYSSPSCERVTGYAAGEFINNPNLLQEIIHSDDWQAFLQHQHDKSLSSHSDIEFRIITKDGEIKWIHHLCQPIYDSKGCYAGNRGSNRDITERKQEEHRIRRYNHILEGINWIFSNVVQVKTEEELGEACLSVALGVTGSEFGYIIEMCADGLLRDVAKSKLAWEQCHMYDKTGHICLPHDYVVHGLYGSVIINGKSFFTNDPQSHPDSAGLPAGHPPIKSFLTVPLILDRKIVGSIGVGNREGGYSYEQQEDLEAIAPAVTQVLQRRKVEQERKLAEQELKASELRFKALVQDLESGVFLIDGEGKFTIYNPAFLQIFNISEQELEYMKIQDFSWDTWNVVDKDGNALRFESHPVQYARINRKPVKNQVIGIRRYSHDDWVWTLVSAEPLLNPDGSINIIICTFTDITQLKNTEDALKIANETLEEKVKERTLELEKAYRTLKEKEELLSDAQEMAHIGNWEHNFVTGKLYWSEEIYRIFGLKRQEFEVSYSLFLSHLHPDDQDYVDNAVKGALRGKPFSIDYRILLANGEERIAHSKGETIFDKENNPVRIRGTTQDITDLRKTEERIKTLANIVESSQDAIGTLSLDGIIISWNKGAEQIYGYSTEKILGKHASILAPSHLDKETMKLIELIKQGESIHQYETSRLGIDGKIISVSITLSPVFDTNGKLSAVSFISRNITERKKAEEALRNFEIARKKELHHRIKNNLQVISSLLDLQADLFKGRKTIKDSEVLKAFKESIDRVLSIALIHEELYKGKNIDLLNFSQYIQELANNLLLTYSLKTDVSLNFDLEEKIFLDMDTAIPLGIIINELITNSFKYAFSSRDNGEIRIKLHKEGNRESKNEEIVSTAYVLSVSDNGIGIPKDLKIEDLDSLGLQLVTSLVDQLDGELQLKKGNGTEFTIKFDVTEKDNLVSAPVSPLQLVDNE
ncbi:MAG TPA: PAS domain S-box protein [Methanosarcina sp.]|nr:PAS domain S-box protein [Methanosarcina sp.]